ncbi:hypothetical protein CCZ01_09445 [Helicobacter monodelphidis]|uniref:hypothetical protein n=1 Tax=Helicobacter sp. 15-1451 TaxID=2004995 RepID=UPI000DCEDCE6|nr:hypothetical protein [Helicobacter sp. 15-1451]RAX56463.1 hypothetical protein CCZ01_09445 [Helicobacter sp. 15-1451]
MSKPIYEEIIDEIGTQTLARCGLNIFSLNTYEAYGASAAMTNDTARAYNRHKNNDNYFGQTFEELDIGQQNIKDSLLNTGHKTYTTDTLADIQNMQGIIASGKKIENLKPEDRAKYDYIMANYGDEVKNMDFDKGGLKQLAELSAKHSKDGKSGLKNHTTIDTVTLDSNGNIVSTAQLKVIKNTDDLLKDKYLENDELRMPFDDYKRHKENLESMIDKGTQSNDPKVKQKAKQAQKALDKLNQNNTTNRLMCENPKATAVITQSIAASGHIVQAGVSDAMVVAISTLANGIIWEIKDMYKGGVDSEVTIMERIKRLINKVMESFKSTFTRGAGFGAVDVVVGVVGQMFQGIAEKLRYIWETLRKSAKSIYNGIHSYIKGEITNYRDLLKTIFKSLFSAAWVVPVVALEQKLQVLIPIGGTLLAPIFAIVAGAFVVVITSRSIDLALDALFGIFAERDKAKLRAEEITELIAEKLPTILAQKDELENLIAQTHKARLMSLESSFADYKKAIANNDNNGIYHALNSISLLYGKELEIKTIDNVKTLLQKPNRTGKLQW